MELRNRTTGAVITDGQLRSEHPNTSFPDVLTPEIINDFGYDPVLEGPRPTLIPPYQYAQRDGVEEINGQWFTKYVAAEPDADGKARMDEEQGKRVRQERNKRLQDCDWTQLPDAPVDAVVWATYRQALRDVTSQQGFPWNVTWPVSPDQEPVRARNADGTFAGDDPATADVNEAWVNG